MPDQTTTPRIKPPPERLYGRQTGHALRPRQERLLAETLPRLRVDPTAPLAALAGCREIWLEVGAGGGEHARALAAAHPTAGIIACEVFRNGLCSLLGPLVAEGAEATGALPANLRVWDDDARVLLRALADAALDRLYLMFPDPWPKARHAKRRLVHPHMLPLLARVLKPGAEWRLASDDPTYQSWVEQVMAAQALFAPASDSWERPAGWPPTRYEAKALRAGRRPRYWVFTRRR